MDEMWSTVVSTQNDDAWFEDYCRIVLASQPSQLPERTMKLGNVQAGWFPTTPGIAHIFASGGTPLDRQYVCQIIEEQLAPHGIKRAQYSLDWDRSDTQLTKEVNEWIRTASNHRFASWQEIEQKAKKLLQEGKVHILRNGAQFIASHVQGEHGDYDCEIQRLDPNSKSITTWSCSCPYDQFAWGRTRKWKKYEGRPCLLEKTIITMADGTFKPITEVEIGDFVMTHNGVGKVTETMCRPYLGSILSITSAGLSNHPLEITPQHDVWGYGTPQRLRGAWQDQKDQGFKFYDESFLLNKTPDWVESKDLKRHDWLTSPIRNFTSGTHFDIKSVIPSDWCYQEENGKIWRTYKRYSKQIRYQGCLNRCLYPSKALMTVLGLYVAEGSMSEVQGYPGQIQWSFAFHERETLGKNLEAAIYEIDSSVELGIYPRPEVGTISYRLTHHVLAFVLSVLAGRYSQHKEWHPWIMNLSPSDQEELIYWHRQGDGSENKTDSRWRIDTSSDILAFQTADMLTRCGRNPFISKRQQKGGPSNREKECWINRISWVDDPYYTNGIRRRNEWNYIANKITSITDHPHDGYVYNLAVEPQQSYVANGRIVHNCKHILATFWLSQSMPLDEEIAPGAETPQEPQAGGGGAMQPEPIPSSFTQVPGGGTGMVPPAGTPGPQKPGMQNQQAPMPQQGIVPGQAPEPQPLIPQYPNDPALQPAINPVSVPGQKPQSPLNPIQNANGTFSHVAAQQFTNGDMVQLKREDVGQSVGLNSGQTVTIPMNSIGEVMGSDPLGLVNVLFSGKVAENWGNLEPHGVSAWLWPSDIILREDLRQPGPAVRRR